MSTPKVTLIVTQRERFSLTKPSLESILSDYASYPFDLIYVDGNSPAPVQQYLQQQAQTHEFITLIRRDRYLRSNVARNIALPQVQDADYIVFLDNDVIIEPGWLKHLVNCAEEEQAGIIVPLILQGQPGSPEIEVHVAGIKTIWRQRRFGKKWFEQKQLLYGKQLREVESDLHRTPVDSVEFHCLMARHSLMQAVVLDEVFDSLASHTDLCLQATDLGEKIFLEPSSRVTFLNPRQITLFTETDIPFYLFKWSEKSIADVFSRTYRKWKIAKDDPSIWSIWKWVIQNRQLPFKWSTEEGSRERKILEFCQRRWCPGWLRTLLEYIVFKQAFPKSGIPSNLKEVVKTSV
ncbi:MAG: glycosyltransferase family 2 protein [Symploca sp. SIO1B1]|nr:glycosyltransferase family 2 protein [Symploca sp. SIO1C2]NER96486.1 glycosyltransferase family 2 protein [Symploca sp. SIO1B1]